MKFLIVFSLIFLFVGGFFLTACQNSSVTAEKQGAIKQISVEQAKQATEKADVQFIDVRTVEEYKSGHAPKTLNLPLDSLAQNLARLDKNKPVYVICETGRRSQKGAEILEKNGFTDLYNIEGGTGAWRSAGFPLEK